MKAFGLAYNKLNSEDYARYRERISREEYDGNDIEKIFFNKMVAAQPEDASSGDAGVVDHAFDKEARKKYLNVLVIVSVILGTCSLIFVLYWMLKFWQAMINGRVGRLRLLTFIEALLALTVAYVISHICNRYTSLEAVTNTTGKLRFLLHAAEKGDVIRKLNYESDKYTHWRNRVLEGVDTGEIDCPVAPGGLVAPKPPIDQWKAHAVYHANNIRLINGYIDVESQRDDKVLEVIGVGCIVVPAFFAAITLVALGATVPPVMGDRWDNSPLVKKIFPFAVPIFTFIVLMIVAVIYIVKQIKTVSVDIPAVDSFDQLEDFQKQFSRLRYIYPNIRNATPGNSGYAIVIKWVLLPVFLLLSLLLGMYTLIHNVRDHKLPEEERTKRQVLEASTASGLNLFIAVAVLVQLFCLYAGNYLA
jgi:hypothetical protein